jgi:hypothetical protein
VVARKINSFVFVKTSPVFRLLLVSVAISGLIMTAGCTNASPPMATNYSSVPVQQVHNAGSNISIGPGPASDSGVISLPELLVELGLAGLQAIIPYRYTDYYPATLPPTTEHQSLPSAAPASS